MAQASWRDMVKTVLRKNQKSATWLRLSQKCYILFPLVIPIDLRWLECHIPSLNEHRGMGLGLRAGGAIPEAA